MAAEPTITYSEQDVPSCSRCGPLPDMPETHEVLADHLRWHQELDSGPTTLGG